MRPELRIPRLGERGFHERCSKLMLGVDLNTLGGRWWDLDLRQVQRAAPRGWVCGAPASAPP